MQLGTVHTALRNDSRIGVAERVLEPTLHARFRGLSATELDIAQVDALDDLAWGTLYADKPREVTRNENGQRPFARGSRS